MPMLPDRIDHAEDFYHQILRGAKKEGITVSVNTVGGSSHRGKVFELNEHGVQILFVSDSSVGSSSCFVALQHITSVTTKVI